MSLDERRRGLMAQMGNGAEIKTASGSIIATENYANVVITHNLGTTKLFGMIWIEPNENGEVVTTSGYQTIFGTFVTWERQNELYSGTTLVSNYTSSSTKTAEWGTINMAGGVTINSGWTSSDAKWNYSRGTLRGIPVDDNSVRIYFAGVSGPYTRNATYKWQVWALE